MVEEKVLTSMRLKKEVKKRLKLLAIQKDLSIGDLIEQLLKMCEGANNEQHNS